MKENVVVSFSSTSGQILGRQSLDNPVGQVLIPVQSANKGVVVVTVADGQDLKFSKQVLL